MKTCPWVISPRRTLGHMDTLLVYRLYGRCIPNLTRRDGSAFEALHIDSDDQKNRGHNRPQFRSRYQF